MNPWKLIIDQVESGYAAYRVFLVWQHTQPCPHELQETSFGEGIKLGFDSKEWVSKWLKENNW